MLFVPVVDSNQKPLMPTTANRAARWIKSGKCTGLLRALSQPSNSFSDITFNSSTQNGPFIPEASTVAGRWTHWLLFLTIAAAERVQRVFLKLMAYGTPTCPA